MLNTVLMLNRLLYSFSKENRGGGGMRKLIYVNLCVLSLKSVVGNKKFVGECIKTRYFRNLTIILIPFPSFFVGLRSGKAGEQCEAIVRFPSLFEKFPFPILINSASLKLAEVFRTG